MVKLVTLEKARGKCVQHPMPKDSLEIGQDMQFWGELPHPFGAFP